jgi:fructose-bisphosphate aldolase, class I
MVHNPRTKNLPLFQPENGGNQMKERRMNRIFKPDGKALIVAMDHGLIDGPCRGLENPAKTIEKIIDGGADAILTSIGTAQRFASLLAPLGLILRADGGATSLGKANGPSAIFYTVEDLLRVGADALAVSGYPGADNEVESLLNIAALVRQGNLWGLPIMAEMVPGGFDSAPEFRSTKNLALAARVGLELGADFIKSPYGPDFTQVTSSCYAPVVILGGAKRGKEADMLADIKAAIECGAAGVAIGRNIFQADNPQSMTAAVAAILHKNASVEEALDILNTA